MAFIIEQAGGLASTGTKVRLANGVQGSKRVAMRSTAYKQTGAASKKAYKRVKKYSGEKVLLVQLHTGCPTFLAQLTHIITTVVRAKVLENLVGQTNINNCMHHFIIYIYFYLLLMHDLFEVRNFSMTPPVRPLVGLSIGTS